MAAWSLASFVLLVGMGIGAAAEPSEPSLTVDYDKLPVIAFYAKNVPAIQILNQLAAALHIEVEYATSVDKSPTISGSFKGDIGDILRRVLLPNAGYLVWYRGSAIDRIYITSSGAAAIAAAAASAPGATDAAAAIDALPAATLTTAAPATASVSPGTTRQKGNPLSNLLQAQASMMDQGVAKAGPADASDTPGAGAAAPRPTLQPSFASAGAAPTSLAAMTQTAQANVRMLVKALNAVCIGASCAQ
jgi:hypothetical protein